MVQPIDAITAVDDLGGSGTGGTGAPTTEQFIVGATSTALSAELVLTEGDGITVTLTATASTATVAHDFVGSTGITLVTSTAGTVSIEHDLVGGEATALVTSTAGTVTLDFTMTALASATAITVDSAADELIIRDATDGTYYSVIPDDLGISSTVTSAPVGATYLVGSADATLTNERVAIGGVAINLTLDSTAGTAKFDVQPSQLGGTSAITVDPAADLLLIEDVTDGNVYKVFPNDLGIASTGAPTDANYLVTASNTALSAERVLTEGTAIDITTVATAGTTTLNFTMTALASATAITVDSAADELILRDATDGTYYSVVPDDLGISGTGGGGGGLVGPTASTDNAIMRYNGTDGTTVQATDLLTFSDAAVLTIADTKPTFQLDETDGPTDEHFWDMFAQTGLFTFRTLNTAKTLSENIMTVSRSGETVTQISFPNGRTNFTGSMVVGAPTGGETNGDGTINAEGVFDDDVLLTDYVFDAHIDGDVDTAKWDALVENRQRKVIDVEMQDTVKDPETGEIIHSAIPEQFHYEEEVRIHQPARNFKENINDTDIDTYCAKWSNCRQLPAFYRLGAERPSTGKSIQALVETCEVQAIHIDSLCKSLKALEARLAVLEV